MPLQKLVFKPGVNRDQTNYANEGGWYECNKVRFFSGFPQKIGGWTRYTASAFAGVCRALFNWSSKSSTTVGDYLAIGTSEKFYVEYGNGFSVNNITPLRPSIPSIAISTIVTVSGSSIITVNFATTHSAIVGNYVCLNGISAAVDGISTTILNSNNGYKILSTPTTTSLTINVGANASSGGTFPPSGTPVAYFEIDVGAGTSITGYGWGITRWGGNTPLTGWGIGAITPSNVELRLIYFDKYVDILLFNIRYGDIYEFNLVDTTTTSYSVSTRAKLLSSVVGATDVPTKVTQILFDSNANILMAFGANPYDPSTVQPQDPLLIRWASQANRYNWTPSDDPGISTAGYLRIQNGSAILRAVSNANEILVFTESAITSVQYTASFPLLFSQKLISSDITVISANAVIVVNNVVYWMGHDKFFMYNGRVEVIPTTLREEVFANIDYDQTDQFHACSNERFNEIWWFYTSGGGTSINRYVIYNYVEDIWYYGDCDGGLVRTAWIDSALRSFPQAASDDGYIYNQEDGVDANGEAITSYITSSDVDIEDGTKFSLIRKIIPDINFNGSNYALNPVVEMTLYPHNFPGQTYFSTNQEGQTLNRPAVSLVVNQYTEQMFVRTRARQIGLKIGSVAKGTNWQLGAPRIEIRPDGIRGYNNISDTVYWYSNTTDGPDILAALVEPPPSAYSFTTDGTDIMSSLIGVDVAFAPVALYDAGLGSSYPGFGTTWNDISGNARNATLVAPSYSSNAFNFSSANNGTNSGPYGVIPSSVPVALSNTPTTGFTISIWFKLSSQYGLTIKGSPLQQAGLWYTKVFPGMISSAPGGYPASPLYIGAVPPGVDTYISAWVNNQPYGYNLDTAVTKNNARGFAPKAGYWHNLIYTYTGATSPTATDALRLYVDGVLIGTNAYDGYTPLTFADPTNTTINVGANGFAGTATPSSVYYMDGSIAVIGIYKPFLNASQIAALYNAYKPRFTNSTYTPVSPPMVTANAVAIYDTDVEKYGEIPNYSADSTSRELIGPTYGVTGVRYVNDFSGNQYDLIVPSDNYYSPAVSVSTFTDPLNPDSPSGCYSYAGKGTIYTYNRVQFSNNTVTSGPLNTILTTDASFSVNIWYYHTYLGVQERPQCIASYTNSGDVWFVIGQPEAPSPYGTDCSVCAAMYNSAGWTKTTAFSPALYTWYQYTMTYDAATKLIRFYVNGSLIGSPVARNTSSRTPSSSRGIVIGARWDNGNDPYVMRGNWANAQIYSSVLTVSEITQNYNHFLPRFT